ncbi:MAG: YeiH family protein [Phyllobacterium sp.]
MHFNHHSRATSLLPGIALCLTVAAAAWGTAMIEVWLFGQAWLETLVLAILMGVAVRSFRGAGLLYARGISFSAKTLLEVAIVLLGASISIGAIQDAGLKLVASIAVVVVLGILFSYWIGRSMGLSSRLSMLVACGNSICGNSAIAATAPVIGADADDVAASIAFTAVLGVIVVLVLPLAVPMFGFSAAQYGIFAGMTVYAVPQVLAATAPVSALSMQVGTLVKLVRVLMLGPVIFTLALVNARGNGRVSLAHMVPWFIVGFLLMMVLRSADLIPHLLLRPMASLSTVLTVISMAALGLMVDVRSVAHAGGKVICTAVLSVSVLAAISYGLIRML